MTTMTTIETLTFKDDDDENDDLKRDVDDSPSKSRFRLCLTSAFFICHELEA